MTTPWPPLNQAHAGDNWVEAKLGRFLQIQTADLKQLMINPYVVIRARPLPDAVDMVCVC